MSAEPNERESNRFGKWKEDFFCTLFEEKEVGKGKQDPIARAADAVCHFSGNAIAQLIQGRTGKHFITNIAEKTQDYKDGFISGLEKVRVEEIAMEHTGAAEAYKQLIQNARKMSWNDVASLRKLMSECLFFVNHVETYAHILARIKESQK